MYQIRKTATRKSFEDPQFPDGVFAEAETYADAWAIVRDSETRSNRVAEKLGMNRNGIVKEVEPGMLIVQINDSMTLWYQIVEADTAAK